MKRFGTLAPRAVSSMLWIGLWVGLWTGACANKDGRAARSQTRERRAVQAMAGQGRAADMASVPGAAPASPPSTAPALPGQGAAPPPSTAPASPGQGAASPGQSIASAPQPGAAGVDSTDSAASAASAAPAASADFIGDARVLYRAVACAGNEPVPAHLNARIVDSHCKRLNLRKDQYRRRYATMAKEFIAKLRPASLPDTVVYPFGGGDLISALVAYPDAREITTMSLEHAGDPRRIRDMSRDELQASLAAFSVELGGMLSVSNNTSKNLSEAHANLLPVQLSLFLVGLAVHDFEPVSVRYIALEDDGSVRYLGPSDIEAAAGVQARQLKYDWQQPNFSKAFSNVEIRFRRRGAGPDEPVRVHRHFAANLANAHLGQNPAILAHLRAKGRVTAMTKAASYLLWRNDFSLIRDYLLEHMDYMISDSTGIPPAYARKQGMVQTPLGRFSGSFLEAPESHNADFLALWSNAPYRRLPFRFGYVDAAKQAHLLITRPAAAGKGASQ